MEVSIIIPVYNASAYLRIAVQSALAAPETQEVILIDDGSNDDSLAMAKQLAAEESRIMVLTHPNGGNRGSAATRNVGIRAAQYEYVAFIDADDWFLPNRFAVAKEIFRQHPDADGVYEAVVNVLSDKAQSFSQKTNLNSVPQLHMVHRAVGPQQLLSQLIDDPTGIILLQGLCVKRTIFEKCGLFDETFRISEDMLLIKKMAAIGNLYPGHLTNPVSTRLIHDLNISFSAFKDTDSTKHTEAEVLLEWSIRENIPQEKRNAILKFYYQAYFYQHGIDFSDKRHRFKWLARTAWRYPSALLCKQYWGAVPVIGKIVK